MIHRTPRNDFHAKYGWYERGDDDAHGATPEDVIHHLWRGPDSGLEIGALEDIVCLRDWLDSITGEFVKQARDNGASWAEVGRALGTSKQAAQQRYSTPST